MKKLSLFLLLTITLASSAFTVCGKKKHHEAPDSQDKRGFFARLLKKKEPKTPEQALAEDATFLAEAIEEFPQLEGESLDHVHAFFLKRYHRDVFSS